MSASMKAKSNFPSPPCAISLSSDSVAGPTMGSMTDARPASFQYVMALSMNSWLMSQATILQPDLSCGKASAAARELAPVRTPMSMMRLAPEVLMICWLSMRTSREPKPQYSSFSVSSLCFTLMDELTQGWLAFQCSPKQYNIFYLDGMQWRRMAVAVVNQALHLFRISPKAVPESPRRTPAPPPATYEASTATRTLMILDTYLSIH